MQTTFYTFVLILHICSGFLGLVSGTIAMLKTNNICTHKKVGKVFFYAMVFIFLTSTIMCFLKPNVFLLLVGFFSFYLTCTGYRILQLKNIYKYQLQPTFIDYLISFIGIISGVAILFLSVYLFQKQNNFGFVCLFFGFVSLFLGYKDLKKFYIKNTDTFFWMRQHAIRMSGAYVATVTAFIVVNVQMNQSWILWILPGLLIIPLSNKIVNNKIKFLQQF